eukprot:87641_1
MDQNLTDDTLPLSKQLNKQFEMSSSIYTTFDPEFPFPSFIEKETMTNDEKEKIIFSIIRYCYTNNIPPSDQYIKQYLCSNQYQKPEATVIDGIYQQIKGKKQTTQIKRMLELQEYDSDALAMDIVMTDKDNSNVGQLLKCDSKYISMQQYMNINTKSDHTSCCAVLVLPEPSIPIIQQIITTHV